MSLDLGESSFTGFSPKGTFQCAQLWGPLPPGLHLAT